MALPFGESRWDYLPYLIQKSIEDLAAIADHRYRMKAVCNSIRLHGEWCHQHQTFLESLSDIYPQSYRLNPSPIESQTCSQCFKLLSPEIALSVCRGAKYFEKEEMDYFSRMFEDVSEDEDIDDLYDADDEDEYY